MSYFKDIIKSEFWFSVFIAVVVLLVYILIKILFSRLIRNKIVSVIEKSKNKLDDKIYEVVRKPLKYIINITILYIIYNIIKFELIIKDTSFIDRICLNTYSTLVIVGLGAIFYAATKNTNHMLEKLLVSFDMEVNTLFIPYLSKLIRFFVVLICLALVFSAWGFDVGAFVAGLGIGGFAIAFAAKETLANLFGGAVILTEKPFILDDWIKVNEIEGSVIDISFRSTRIRQFDKGVVTVPNSIVASSNIINYSKRNSRRATYEINLHLDTKYEELENFIKIARKTFENNQDIDKDEDVHIVLKETNKPYYRVFFYFFIKTTSYKEYLEMSEKINMDILKILDGLDIKIANQVTDIKLRGSDA